MADETPTPETKRVVIFSNQHRHKDKVYRRGSIVDLPVSAADYLISHKYAVETDKPVKHLLAGKPKKR